MNYKSYKNRSRLHFRSTAKSWKEDARRSALSFDQKHARASVKPQLITLDSTALERFRLGMQAALVFNQSNLDQRQKNLPA
ncbi:hypothetical protein Hypma_000297 [Hypsizygus marmoreus]|uniref:Uncharacterized protein n=1 Tax=Hypsizygus marmoreus TaxID=39966 RepID=A0A369J9B3_HYPMA|nr:hypothetical protein Hypma_000297 [Hypsizygus marmoreus]